MKRSARSWGIAALTAATVLAPLAAGIAAAAPPAPAPGGTFEADSPRPPANEQGGAQMIGGSPAKVSDYPPVIAHIREGGSRPEGQSCTASLVSPTKILIAAHCYGTDLPGAKQVVYGLDNLADYKGGSGTGFQYAKVASFKIHPKYTRFDESGYDIAIGSLDREVKPINGVFAKWATSADKGVNLAGRNGRAYGYGKKDKNDTAKDVTLHSMEMPINDGSGQQCRGWGRFNNATMICTGYANGTPKQTLPGDSGGPLVVDGKVFGLCSWGSPNWDWWSVYTRLNHDGGDWITEQVGTVSQDPTISASPSSVTVEAGKSVSTTIGSTGTGSIKLSASGLPTGVKAVFAPADLTAGENAKLTFDAASTATSGTSKVTVNGTTAAGKTITTSVDLTVKGSTNPGPFGLSLSPSSLTVQPGQSGSTGLTTTAGSGGPEDIKLTASGLPSGASVTFQPSDSIKTGDSAKVQVATASSTPKGAYTVTVTGTNAGGKTATTELKLTVGEAGPADFSISANPGSATLNKSSSVSVGLTSTGSGEITLSARNLPSGVTAEFQPAKINGGSGSKVTLTADGTVKTADVTVQLVGASGGTEKTADLKLSVKGDGGGNPGTLNVALDNSSGTIQQAQTATFKATLAGGTGTIAVTASGVPGAFYFINPKSVAQGGTSTIQIFTNFQIAPGTYPVTVTGTSADGKTGQATYTLTITPFGRAGFTMAGDRMAL